MNEEAKKNKSVNNVIFYRIYVTISPFNSLTFILLE